MRHALTLVTALASLAVVLAPAAGAAPSRTLFAQSASTPSACEILAGLDETVTDAERREVLLACELEQAITSPEPVVPPALEPVFPPVSAGIGPRDGVPLCAVHDDTQWHPLYDPVLDCHYDHTHKFNPDDPNLVAIFGDVRQWTLGQSISYPWLTGDGAEQTHKHEGYQVDGRWDEKCNSSFARNCITAFRVQVHAVGSLVDEVARFHSQW